MRKISTVLKTRPKVLDTYLQLSRFAADTGLDPTDVATLVVLANRAFICGEREHNVNSPAVRSAGSRARGRFIDAAAEAGFKAVWDGLWPSLVRGDQRFELPGI